MSEEQKTSVANEGASDRHPQGDAKDGPQAGGGYYPPRDEEGTPAPPKAAESDAHLTEEAEESLDVELATGDSIDQEGRDVRPPPMGSEDELEEQK